MNNDDIIELWLEAEEELRNGNDLIAINLKTKFSNEFSKLSLDDKKYITNEFENLAL